MTTKYISSISSFVGGLFSGLIILSIVTTTYYADHRHHNYSIDLAENFTSKVGSVAIEQSSRYLENASISAQLAHAQLERDPTILEDKEGLKNILASILKTYPSIYSIYVGLPNDNYYQIRRENDPEKYKRSKEMFWRVIEDTNQKTTSLNSGITESTISPYRPTQRPWYKKALAEKEFTWTEDYAFESIQSLGITATIPLIQDGEVIAVIGADITLSDLDTFLSGVEIAPGSKAFIINKNKEVLAYPDENVFLNDNGFYVPQLEKIEPKPILDAYDFHTKKKFDMSVREEGDVFHTTHSIIELNEQRHIIIILDYPETINSEWTLILYAPLKYFWGPKDEIREVVIYISLLILLIAIMVSRYIARHVSTPIRTLANRALTIPSQQGNRNFKLDTGITELIVLSNALQQMQEGEEKLLEVSSSISAEIELEPLFQKAMNAVTYILQADRSTLFLYDNQTQELWSVVAEGVNSKQIRFPCDTGIAGHVFITSDTINITDAYTDVRFNTEIDKKTGYKTKSILCMPIMNKGGESLGVIQVLNKFGGVFTEVDEMRLMAFGAQVAIAIENAQMFNEVKNVKNYNEAVLESMHQGMITTDAQGFVVKANSKAINLFAPLFQAETIWGEQIGVLFTEQNTWISELTQGILEQGGMDEALDAQLSLPDEPSISVNLKVQELKNAKDSRIGCLLLFEDISREKRIKSTMAQYLSKEITDKLFAEEEQMLGGTLQETSVLFSDIRSFTNFTEKNGPQETVRMLNSYFTEMYEQIVKNKGILDKYIGDAIMAVFGTPFPSPEDADNSLQSAIGMIRALKEFNMLRIKDNLDPVAIGIGVNTGEVVAGNIGSDKRMDFTVIGDAVNLAARLESATKVYDTPILISSFTKNALKKDYVLREVDLIVVKGKEEPVAVFEVIDALEQDQQELRQSYMETYKKALANYRKQNWIEAQKGFEKMQEQNSNDQAIAIYMERIHYFVQNPPDENWNGVWVMKGK
jgi:adenylate cyclase